MACALQLVSKNSSTPHANSSTAISRSRIPASARRAPYPFASSSAILPLQRSSGSKVSGAFVGGLPRGLTGTLQFAHLTFVATTVHFHYVPACDLGDGQSASSGPASGVATLLGSSTNYASHIRSATGVKSEGRPIQDMSAAAVLALALPVTHVLSGAVLT